MPIDYGKDRVFLFIKTCEACSRSHTEMEFKRLATPDENGNTHKARCPSAKTFVYIRLA